MLVKCTVPVHLSAQALPHRLSGAAKTVTLCVQHVVLLSTAAAYALIQKVIVAEIDTRQEST